MKSFEQYVSDMRNDQALADEIRAEIRARVGDQPDIETVDSVSVEVAKDKGYDIKVEDLQKYREELSESISEEELGKVAGGFSCGWAVFSLAFVSMTGLIASMSVIAQPDPDET